MSNEKYKDGWVFPSAVRVRIAENPKIHVTMDYIDGIIVFLENDESRMFEEDTIMTSGSILAIK